MARSMFERYGGFAKINRIVMSFYEWHGFGEPRPVGLYNYKWMIGSDVLFHQALKVTANYALYAIPLQIILAFLMPGGRLL